MDEKRPLKNYARPLPQKIQIGYDGTTIYGNNIYMEPDKADVPIMVLSHEDVVEKDVAALSGKSFAINLGSYKSQLMAGLVWFKVKSLYRAEIAAADLVEAPSESYPDKTTKKYSLRLSLDTSDINEAYRRCQTIADKGQECSLEVLPGALEGKAYEPPSQMQANAQALKR